MKRPSTFTFVGAILPAMLSLLLTACVDVTGGADTPQDPQDPTDPTQETLYNINGTVTGLQGSEDIVLEMSLYRPDGIHDWQIESEVTTGNGSFTFPLALPDNETFHIDVYDHPNEPVQRCTVEGSPETNPLPPYFSRYTGTVVGNDVNLLVTCEPAYTVSVNLTGLEEGKTFWVDRFVTEPGITTIGKPRPGDPRDMGTDHLFRADGSFTFGFPDLPGEQITVSTTSNISDWHTRPDLTDQRCIYKHDGVEEEESITFTMGEEDAIVDIACEPRYPLIVEVSGLEGGQLTITNTITNETSTDPKYPLGENLSINTNGENRFETHLSSGESYQVTVSNQPSNPAQKCTVRNASGTIAAKAPQVVTLSCGAASIGGVVEGMLGSGLHLELATDDGESPNLIQYTPLAIDQNGQFRFDRLVATGTRYQVTITSQPTDPGQECTIENGEGFATDTVTDIRVRCPGPVRVAWFTREPEHDVSEEVINWFGEVYREFEFTPDRSSELLGVYSGLGNTPLFQNHFNQPGTQGALYSNETGKTYWVLAESTTGLNPMLSPHLMQTHTNKTELETIWRLRKDRADARFSLVISRVEMVGYDAGHDWFIEQPYYSTLDASAYIDIYAYNHDPDVGSVPFFSAYGEVELEASADFAGDQHRTIWNVNLRVPTGEDQEIWGSGDFDLNDHASVGTTYPDQVAYLELNRQIPVEVDLSSIPVGAEFYVISDAGVRVHNQFTQEGSIAAYLRDPAEAVTSADSPGMEVVDMSGLSILEPGVINPHDLPSGGGGAPAEPCPSTQIENAVLEFDADSYQITEAPGRGNGQMQPVRILRGGGAEGLVTASISLINSTGDNATPGEDFIADDRSVRFGDGSVEPRTFDDFVIDDDLDEGEETLTLVLHSPAGCAVIGQRSTASVTILPSDPSPGTVAFSSDYYEVDEAAGSFDVTIERLGGSFGTASVTVTSSDGSAVAGIDYGAVDTQVVFQDGDTTPRTINIPIIDNTEFDGDRTVELAITATYSQVLGSPLAATLTIRDDEASDHGSLQFSQASYSVGEVEGSVTATVSRSGGSVGVVSVTVGTLDGDAVAPDDYGALSQIVSFADGETTPQSVTIGIANDAIAEGNERFSLVLSSPAGGVGLGSLSEVPVIIVDDDGLVSGPPGAPVVTLNNGTPKQLRFDWGEVSDATFYRFLMDETGGGSYTQVGGDLPFGTTTFSLRVSVHLLDWSNARFLVQACNSDGCTDSNILTGTAAMLGAIGYFKASNSEGDDYLGNDLALSTDGRTLAVGAGYEDSSAIYLNGDQADNSLRDAGAVYLFNETPTGWVQQAYVKASNAGANDHFGAAVALSADGNTLAVGAPNESSNATGINGDSSNNLAGASGAVYLYTRSGDVWSLQAYVKASNTDTGDVFGSAVALSGDGSTLIVGAPEEASATTGIGGDEADNSTQQAGAAYVFNRTGSAWSQTAYIKASNTGLVDDFGSHVAISGDGLWFAVSAPSEDSAATGIDGDQSDNSALRSGAVYLFHNDGSNWTQEAYVKASNTDPDDRFGVSLSFNGDGSLLVIGASGEDGSGTGVNSSSESDNGADGAGAAYVFAHNGALWQQTAYLKASNTKLGNYFADAVAASADGRYILVGAWSEDSRSVGVNGDQTQPPGVPVGAAYLFVNDGLTGDWSQAAYIKASNSDQTLSSFGRNLNFGASLDISADGAVLAIGAPGEPSDARGIGGDQTNENAPQSGAVYLY